MTKSERFQLTDVNASEIMRKFAIPNKAYERKATKPGEKVYEYIFKPIKASVVAEGKNLIVKDGTIRIGTVKKGSTPKVKNLIEDPDYKYGEIEIGGGRYKTLDLDGNGNLKEYKGSYGLWAHLIIILKPSIFKRRARNEKS